MLVKRISYTRYFYFRLLISFILLTILIVISISVIFSKNFTDTLYTQITVNSNNSMNRLNTDLDNLFRQLIESDFLLRKNSDIQTFLTGSNFDSSLINHVDIYMRQIQNTNQYLNSIILYNKKAEYPIISGKFNIIPNQFFTGMLKSPNSKSIIKFVACTTTDNVPAGTKSLETLSAIFTDPDNTESLNDNLIIMNLDREQIEKQLLGKFDGTSIITDNSGKIIFSSGNYSGMNGYISTTQYFSRILAAKEPKGNFNLDLDKGQKIITYSQSRLSGFYIINIESFDSISKSMRDKNRYFILISLIVIFVFVIGAFLISRFIYSPIRKITDMFSNSKYGSPGTQMGELAVISKVFNETLVHIKELEIKTENNNNRLKEDFLRHLLISNVLNTSENKEDYTFNIEFENLIHIAVKIDGYSQMDDNKRLAYISTLCRTLPELLKKDFKCETVNMFEGEIALLLNYRNAFENGFELLLLAMDNLREVSKKTLDITLSIGIGGVSNTLEECSNAYTDAVDVVKHRFILGTNKTLFQRYLNEHITTNQHFPLELEEKLIISIKSNKKEAFIKNLEAIFELLKDNSYSEAVSIFFQILTSCIKTINQTTSQQNNRYYLNFDELSSIFSSLQTLDQAKLWLINIFNEYQSMLEEINQLKNSKHYNLVEKIQNTIKQNYNDLSLTAESLADSVGYTPYYFSRIFKEITGINVPDYIRQIRINKAKEFLGIYENKINEIPGMIGFTNISHFYAVFKKDVGLTPAAYREYVLQNTYKELSE